MGKRHLFKKAVFTLLIPVFLLTVISSLNSGSSLSQFKSSKSFMDTVFTITVYSDRPGTAEKAVTEAFSEIKRIEAKLNIYSSKSEISRLNKSKILESPSKDIKINIEKSLYYSNLSDGAFDITVQPVLDLYKKTFSETGTPPTDIMIKDELKKVNYKKILMSNKSIKIGKDQRITLGGIAKGYSAGIAAGVLKKHRITMALIDAGGNMTAIGRKPGDSWNIALRDPRNAGNYITIIPLENNAVSTSGDYERFFDESRKFHHIINPKTGYSATELISVTIVTDNAFDADVLSTTVFVLGKEKGMKLIESLPDAEGIIITKERKILRSSGFKEKETE